MRVTQDSSVICNSSATVIIVFLAVPSLPTRKHTVNTDGILNCLGNTIVFFRHDKTAFKLKNTFESIFHVTVCCISATPV
jgi:hypothetical protein